MRDIFPVINFCVTCLITQWSQKVCSVRLEYVPKKNTSYNIYMNITITWIWSSAVWYNLTFGANCFFYLQNLWEMLGIAAPYGCNMRHWGSHSGEFKHHCLLIQDAVCNLRNYENIWRNVLSPHSVINMEISRFRLNVCNLSENVKSLSPYAVLTVSLCLSTNCIRNKPAIA